jgi:ABC-type lipoprotein release transport system permease subunit
MMSVSTLRIAWRSLGRNFKRTLLVAGAIAVGQFAFLATSALMHGYGEQFFNAATGPMLGHAQVHAYDWREDRSIDLTLADIDGLLVDIRSDSNVAHASARIYAPAMAALTEDGFMGVVVGVDPETECHEAGLLPVDGMGELLGEHRVLVGAGFAKKHDIEPGMEIAIIGQDMDGSIASDLYTVEDVMWSAVEIIYALGIVMSLDDAQELLLMPDQAHEIVVHTSDRELIDETVVRLSHLPSLADLEVLSWKELAPFVITMATMVDLFAYIVLIVVFIAAAAGIANTMLMSTFERTHEFGMLLSLGCSPGRLSTMIAVEAAILGLVGVAIGTLSGIGFVAATSESGLNYAALGGSDSYEVAFKGMQFSLLIYPRIYAKDIVIAVAAILATSLMAVVWPIMRIVRLRPVEAMRS